MAERTQMIIKENVTEETHDQVKKKRRILINSKKKEILSKILRENCYYEQYVTTVISRKQNTNVVNG